MTSKLSFYRSGNRGTVKRAVNFNPEEACEQLYQSMKGLGTDESVISEVLTCHTFHERQQIKQLYRNKYGKDLVKELDSELSFSFLKTVLALMTQPETYVIECIHHAISKSLLKQLQKIIKKGTLLAEEYILIGLLFPRSNDDLEAIKALYKLKYNNDLEDDIGNDLGDELRLLVLDIISGGREEEYPDTGVDLEKVDEDANNLLTASLVPTGEICGTKERVLQQILNTRSHEHLRQLFPVYKEFSNKTIEEYVETSNLVPELKEAYLAILKILQNEPEFYADRLRDAVEGIGTNDFMLIVTLVLRSEIDLIDIMTTYERKFGVTLQEDVRGDTSGDYLHILQKLLHVPQDEPVTNRAMDTVEGEPEEPELLERGESRRESTMSAKDQEEEPEVEEILVDETDNAEEEEKVDVVDEAIPSDSIAVEDNIPGDEVAVLPGSTEELEPDSEIVPQEVANEVIEERVDAQEEAEPQQNEAEQETVEEENNNESTKPVDSIEGKGDSVETGEEIGVGG